MPRLVPRFRASASSTQLTHGANGPIQWLPPEGFKPRLTFPLPETVPSWYVGHMDRAMRSLPSLLARRPPPLVIEVRDARLPITSINPAFESQLRRVERTNGTKTASDHRINSWEARRLVVYTRRDLIDRRLEEPLTKAFFRYGQGQQILFADTRVDADVRKVWQWLRKRALELAALPPEPLPQTNKPGRASRRLTGAFRHTTTPEEGVRVVIVGMPNVGKSSLLNSLRRIGNGKGKAASTAPQPGHTRKLTGTVRITKDAPKPAKTEKPADAEDHLHVKARGKARIETFDLTTVDPSRPKHPPIYVYDTPGVMVPFLGRGRVAAEKGIKLALAAGMKSSLFDTQGLADYLLFRMNLRYGFQLMQWWLAGKAGLQVPSQGPRALYLDQLPMPSTATVEPTNDVYSLLQNVLAPGVVRKGGERDLDGCAEFMVHRWREGKLGIGELDVGFEELSNGAVDPRPDGTPFESVDSRVDRLVKDHFLNARLAEQAGVNKSAWQFRPDEIESRHSHGPSGESRLVARRDEAREMVRSELVSTNQVRKRVKAAAARARTSKLHSHGVIAKRGSAEAKLLHDREKHKKWLIRTGKLKVSGKWRKVHRA